MIAVHRVVEDAARDDTPSFASVTADVDDAGKAETVPTG
jgi:hypothetical protein